MDQNTNMNSLVGKVVCVRWVKPYAEAHNHVAFGKVLAETPYYITLYCKTYHVGKHRGCPRAKLIPNKSIGGILEGDKRIRHIPWSRIVPSCAMLSLQSGEPTKNRSDNETEDGIYR